MDTESISVDGFSIYFILMGNKVCCDQTRTGGSMDNV